VIERDYLLSIVLESISRVPFLRENTLLKGGTALKKLYDENYGSFEF
jgi:predicted nucleotidyltransferase component of viral defense system